jgi:uncharacterized protein with HEPN domain
MFSASLLSIIEEASVAVLTLTEGLEKEEFLKSRLTRAEVTRQLKTMTDIIVKLPPETRTKMAELDWDGWTATARRIGEQNPEADEALWFATQALIPATIMWLRVYRQNQPGLFECVPEASPDQ